MFDAVGALPSSVRIGAFDFEIEQVQIHDAIGSREWGSCVIAALKIKIQREMPSPIKAVDTFMHEILHAIFWAYGIQDEDKEERVVGSAATALTALHRDNPWLSSWIANALAAANS